MKLEVERAGAQARRPGQNYGLALEKVQAGAESEPRTKKSFFWLRIRLSLIPNVKILTLGLVRAS